MGYTLKIVLENREADPTGMLCEVIQRERDLLDEIFAELALIVTTHGRKGIIAIIIMKDEDKIEPLDCKECGHELSDSHCKECGQPR